MKRFSGAIVFVIKDEKVLLAKKTRVLGVGKWNGYGGNFDPKLDRDFKDCAVREFTEESGGATIDRDDLEQVCDITFHNGDKFEFRVEVYLAHKITGEPRDSVEMVEPTWFLRVKLPPAEEFMESDPYWISRILAGDKLYGHVWRDEEFRLTARAIELEVVDHF